MHACVNLTAVLSEEVSSSVASAGMDLPAGLNAAEINRHFSTPSTNILFT